MTVTEHFFTTAEECAEVLAASVADGLQKSLSETGSACLAVSGGKSPTLFFQKLSQSPIYWKKVTIIPIDERHVPEDDPESNAFLIRKYLLQNHAKNAKFISLYRDADYERNIGILNEEFYPFPYRITAAILGMGADGHTASYFPHSANLESALFDPVNSFSEQTAPTEPKKRITMNFSVLAGAENLYLQFGGIEKRRTYEKSKQKLSPLYPIGVFLHTKEIFVRAFIHN